MKNSEGREEGRNDGGGQGERIREKKERVNRQGRKKMVF